MAARTRRGAARVARTQHGGTTIYALAEQSGVAPGPPAAMDGVNAIFNVGTLEAVSYCLRNATHAPFCVPEADQTDVAPDAFGGGAWAPLGGVDTRAAQLGRWRSRTCRESLSRSWFHTVQASEPGADGDVALDSDLCPPEQRGPVRQFVSVEMPMFAWAWSLWPSAGAATMTVIRNPLGFIHSRVSRLSLPIHHHEKRHGLALLTAPDVTDNYALRWLAGNVAFDRPVTEVDLARAEDRLRRFGWVGVIEAYRDSLAFLCSDWGWSECDPDRFALHGHAVKKSTRAEGIAAHALRSLANEVPANASTLAALIEQNALSFRLYDAGVELTRSRLRAAGKVSSQLERLPRDSLAHAREQVELLRQEEEQASGSGGA